MSDTVRTAIADLPVEDAVCLEAGAGAGNASVALADAGAERVYAVTDDADHADRTRERVDPGRVSVLTADLAATPLPDDSVDVVTAHALVNVVSPETLGPILAELARVARSGAWLVVDDYDPVPETSAAAPVADLFDVENAASRLATGDPALTFYPESLVRRLCAGYGWRPTRTETLLDPVPWTPDLLSAHVDLVREHAAELPADLGDALVARAEAAEERAGDGVDTGRMYSVAFRREE
ncbi:class I SAM-dependent methyltransferase [Halomicrococcus sp. SG-WS-1]|uniref:class I SAM-dependent methyltransferase n=1 Tax=Halomicrococcus sp. SG-WS-1 TaxID=3439057 RepID=UPI003F7A3679